MARGGLESKWEIIVVADFMYYRIVVNGELRVLREHERIPSSITHGLDSRVCGRQGKSASREPIEANGFQ